jgi:hypothetical protein
MADPSNQPRHAHKAPRGVEGGLKLVGYVALGTLAVAAVSSVGGLIALSEGNFVGAGLCFIAAAIASGSALHACIRS